ncbi:2OG-Fe(II) oxygenase [Cytobacillus firmus]|uniref:2OG-Fe(II) oxygenase n=1 Tax=Cytobacillus firmus TaxID=1399 RepID=UPI003001FF75
MKKDSSKTLYFNDIRYFNHPYPHIQVNDVLIPSVANEILNWLKKTKIWEVQDTTNQKSMAFNLEPSIIPEELVNLFSGPELIKLLHRFEEIFNESFDNKMVVTAFKHRKGEGTAIHNDFGADANFTHRFILYVNDGWTEQDGGSLGLFSSESIESLVKVVNPIHNTGVGLVFSQDSHHAVGAVRDGVRYSLVFSLTAIKC